MRRPTLDASGFADGLTIDPRITTPGIINWPGNAQGWHLHFASWREGPPIARALAANFRRVGVIEIRFQEGDRPIDSGLGQVVFSLAMACMAPRR